MINGQRTLCPTRKFRYRTERSAENTLTRIWQQPKPGRRLETRVYPCPYCEGFHLTSKPKED